MTNEPAAPIATEPEWPMRDDLRSADGSPRLRVLIVSLDMTIGGLERVVATLCRHLDRTRFDPAVCVLRDPGPFSDELEAEGFPVFHLPRDPDQPAYFQFWDLAKLLRRHRVDVLHTHNTAPLLVGGLARLLAWTPTLIHTDHARDFPDKTKYMIAEHVLSWVATRMVGVSAHTTQNLRRYEKIARHKLLTIWNGIDPLLGTGGTPADALRAELGIPAHHAVIGLASRHEDQKNLAMLVEAFARVHAAVPDVTLVLCGDGDCRPDLEAQAERLGVADRVCFPGMRNDAVDIVRLFDLYTMTSHWEGLPMAILESMALGIPVVSTAVGGVPDAVREGETGALVEPGDVEGFAARVIELLCDDARRQTLGAGAKRVFEAEFSAGAMARRYEAAFERRWADLEGAGRAPRRAVSSGPSASTVMLEASREGTS
jgi:glycosyltransferase involved in cell wall biosynthesis